MLMLPVGKAGSASAFGSGPGFGDDRPAEPDAAPVQRALVRVIPESPTTTASLRPADARASAPFLAHLIATVQGAPQTRARRRIDPNWATTTYARMMQKPAAAGRKVRENR